MRSSTLASSILPSAVLAQAVHLISIFDELRRSICRASTSPVPLTALGGAADDSIYNAELLVEMGMVG